MNAPDPASEPDDRWGYRALRPPEDYDPRDGTRLPDAPALPASPGAAAPAAAQEQS